MREIKLLPNSEVEIIGEISADNFMAAKPAAFEELSEMVEINGFRKGKIPEDVLARHIGNEAFLERMAIIALEKEYQKIIQEHKIKPIGRPEITITKMAENNPLGFKLKTAVLPEPSLPDYKNIAKKIVSETKNDIVVEDKEVDHAIDHIRKSRAEKKNPPDGKEEDVFPELNDEFARKVGKFDNVESLKKAIRENILEDKKIKQKEKKRLEIMEKIIEKMEVELPAVLIEGEKSKMLEEMKNNIVNMGLKWEDYLTHIKKKEEELKKDWDKDAIKRVKLGLALNEIAEKEKIGVPEEDLEKETNAAIEYYKGLGQKLDKERVKNHLFDVIRNERVFRMLEEAK